MKVLIDQPHYEASKNMAKAIEKVTYEGQPAANRFHHTGYEEYLNRLPVITPTSPDIEILSAESRETIQALSEELRKASWVKANAPGEGGFNRTVLAIEEPKMHVEGKPGAAGFAWKEGAELIMVRWGNNFSSPVHGHAAGYMHEEILFGKMRVNTYKMTGANSTKVRPVKTEIVGPGTFVSAYAEPNAQNFFKRQTLIHNFTSIGNSASVHFLPEHTRDGRDNKFEVEYFEDSVPFEISDVARINSYAGMYLQKGDVVLVRSTNVPEYGDHFIVVTGAPVKKEHGFRVQEEAIHAPNGKRLLDQFEPEMGLILLKLNKAKAEEFLAFHGIQIVNKEVIFPKA